MDNSTSGRTTSLLKDDTAPNRTGTQKLISGLLTFWILGLCVMNSAVAALCISEADSAKSTGQVFLALYMFVFALVIFIYELSQTCGNEHLDRMYAKNFGFMYNPLGKGAYLFL
jgi:hypothetical protein